MEGDEASVTEIAKALNFYPRPPGGGRQLKRALAEENLQISIHALRVEGDFRPMDMYVDENEFLSTPSGWRATVCFRASFRRRKISIHALRVEGDSKNGQSFCLFLRKREKNLPL